MKVLISIIVLSLSFCCVAQDTPTWIGKINKYSERAPSTVCPDNVTDIIDGQVVFSSWDWQRAVITNLCFEIYIRGLTDQVEIRPGNLDVYANVPFKYPARFIKKKGNNWLYVLNLKDYAPIYPDGSSANGNKAKWIKFKLYAKEILGDGRDAVSNDVEIKFDF